jgi:hypothetical protein
VHAPEQRDAEPRLERLDLPADRRLREGDLLAGAGEAQVTRRRLEDRLTSAPLGMLPEHAKHSQ